MDNYELQRQQDEFIREFNKDSQIIGDQTVAFLRHIYPSYLVDQANIEPYIDSNGVFRLQSMTFFRIASCTADNVDNVYKDINERFEKLFTALYSIDVPIAYGIISRNGITNLVLGVYECKSVESVKAITQGMLSGIDLESFACNFVPTDTRKMSYGILAGVPSLFVNGEKQHFSLSSIMRSLNGQNYTLLFIAKPVNQKIISQNIADLISIRDNAFAVSKRNVARSNSFSQSESKTTSSTDSRNSIAGQVGSGAGASAGAAVGALIGSFVPGVGTLVGSVLGGTIGGGLGTIIGSIVGGGKSHSEGMSKSIAKTITNGETVSGDIQNGFALELMNYADNAIERLKGGQNNGIWQTAITYSAETDIARNIIRACLCGELSKLDAEKLPMRAFEPKQYSGEFLRIPAFLDSQNQNPLCAYINSAELGLLCTVPTESVPDFELRREKKFPMLTSRLNDDKIVIGTLADGKRSLDNMPFALSEQDLNKHTFVCGITGSGKTTTVKKILIEAKKPFLVIESAKKEYRNIAVDTTVYTLGKPEINAPQINPFYIMPGVSPQIHIDYLKDLFNASFSFYGPMPYILEKCLHAVYRNKGWDLTLGYHPMLTNSKSEANFFSIDYVRNQYAKTSHKYLFPTMQELKDEIARYIDDELKYDGEVAGNVKTAMKVRLENLCVGAKGYSFNTNNFLDFDKLLHQNVVFELEGLADDSDKAFSVGLLVIFINEYRQVQKELSGSQTLGLKHLLVIEEAHRLLKNVDTERSTEYTGNPKGKAVEHFTNMIAEMRSYGQGVIVAEQIPNKLAPDVIKNSSTKIIQRIVSADDQQTVANTIGISGDDAIQIGSLETGFAYCHKEGMVLPALVKIANSFRSNNGNTQSLDVYVSDEQLYNHTRNKFEQIALSMIRSFLGGEVTLKRKALAFLNTLMIESPEVCITSCHKIMRYLVKESKRQDINLPLIHDSAHLHAEYITEIILSMMVRGVYRTQALPNDELVALLKQTLYSPSKEKINRIKKNLQLLYTRNTANYAKLNIAVLVKRSLQQNTDIMKTIQEYFIDASDKTIHEIEELVRRGNPI